MLFRSRAAFDARTSGWASVRELRRLRRTQHTRKHGGAGRRNARRSRHRHLRPHARIGAYRRASVPAISQSWRQQVGRTTGFLHRRPRASRRLDTTHARCGSLQDVLPEIEAGLPVRRKQCSTTPITSRLEYGLPRQRMHRPPYDAAHKLTSNSRSDFVSAVADDKSTSPPHLLFGD